MSTIHNVIIIWSWPAGHTAAIYTWRALLEPLMFEWWMAWWVAAWGQLTTTTEVENFPGFPTWIQGPELMMNMRQQSANSWCTIQTKTVDSVVVSENPLETPHKVIVWAEEFETRTLIICTWAIAKRLGLPGEETYWQNGVSACAVCDWALPIFRNKHLVVIWWGDSACEEANYLTKFATKVTMIVRRDELRASKVMQERVKNNEKIEILWNTEGKEIFGNDWLMTWMKIHNNKTDEQSEIEAGGLFYAIGHKPNTSFLHNQVHLDETGYIKVLPGTAKALRPESDEILPWVFAAGDVQDKVYRQAITSAWTWCMAAIEAEHFLS